MSVVLELGPHATRDAPSTMAATIDHLATAAADHLLRAGGSAVDAAIGASAVLAVTSPHLCGMGGDLLALVHDGPGPPTALDATGRAGSRADAARLRDEGHDRVPFRHHPAAVTVPGCVDGWVALHERYGVLALSTVLADAVALAEDGFPAAPLLHAAAGLLADAPQPAAHELAAQADRVGAVVRRPGVAAALRAVAAEGRGGFYEGTFGAGLLDVAASELTADDLTVPQARWVEPLGRSVWGHDVWTMPPTSQGYLTLAGAWVLERLEPPQDPTDPQWAHLVVEAVKQVGRDRPHVLHEDADPAELLDPLRLARALDAVDPTRASPASSPAGDGDTIYLCVADGDGMAVSLIQSTAADFGSHLFEPATGINLHNRGIGFRLDPGHPATLGPGRRPPTTLAPALVTTSAGDLRAVLGTMGGDTQPQIVLQLLARLLGLGQRPGTCIAAPRVYLTNRGRSFTLWEEPARVAVAVEGHAPADWVDGLRSRGHDVVERGPFDLGAGHAQLIERAGHGGWGGAADPRAGIGSALGH